MKKLEQDRLEKLFELIETKPAIRIAHFCDGGAKFTKMLSNLCLEKEYEYQINCINEATYEEMMERYKEIKDVQPVKMPLARPRYFMQAKEYEYLFVTATIPQEQRSDFIKKCFPLIVKGGNIIVFLPKNDHSLRYNWIALLEEHYYVATSTIDDLFEHYDVVISKKMHGWGNK